MSNRTKEESRGRFFWAGCRARAISGEFLNRHLLSSFVGCSPDLGQCGSAGLSAPVGKPFQIRGQMSTRLSVGIIPLRDCG